MWQTVAGVIQILFLVLKNKFERDEAERKRKEALHEEAKDAVKSRDISRINSVIERLR